MPTESSQTELPLVSIIIPMLNEAGAIGRCIHSILAQSYPGDRIEVLVVDGLSTDGSREEVQALAAAHANIRLLDNPQKRTPRSLNIGVRNSRGKVVIILGAHTRIDPEFVALNIRYMREMRVKCTGGTQINTGDTYWQRAIGLGMGSRFGIPSAPYRYDKRKRFVDTVVYAAYARELFDEVGYFDEELHISEDAELNWRIRKAGHQIYFTPEIISYYYPRATLRRLWRQFFNYGILRVNVIKKHPDAVKAVHLVPPAFVLATLLFGVLAVFRPAAAWALALLWGLYLVYLLVAAITTCREEHHFAALPALPPVFMTMQIGWGLGFWAGLFKTYK
ncbi:MAG TPA: glycosyltransferase family 2 protein [bacterium]|nr:glycosyltransferase family 2 protein [bacterium]HQG45800.1 glycosyltransferase family 2 protein [bacterium]HQI47707.1 glycosyltransferase family 2 protein [bacterium]HQJ63480.1 glycosyltransferase family 2 protein [bacterium]